MKTYPFPFIVVVLSFAFIIGLPATVHAQFKKVPPVKVETKKKVKPADVIRFKMKKIIIPKIAFESTPLDEAVSFLRKQALANDKISKKPAGINIILRLPKYTANQPAPPIPVISELKIQNITLEDAIKYITELTGMHYKVDDNAVVIYHSSTEKK